MLRAAQLASQPMLAVASTFKECQHALMDPAQVGLATIYSCFKVLACPTGVTALYAVYQVATLDR